MFCTIDLKFRWEDGEKSVQMSPDVALPQFNILGHRQRIVEASLSSGNYSRLLADVQFDRALGYYVIQVTIGSSSSEVCVFFFLLLGYNFFDTLINQIRVATATRLSSCKGLVKRVKSQWESCCSLCYHLFTMARNYFGCCNTEAGRMPSNNYPHQ